MTSPRDQFFSPLRSDKGWKGCRGNLSQLSRLGQSSGLSSGPLPPGEQPLLQRRLWTPSRGLLSPPSALAAGIFLGSYRGEPGGAPGGKTQNSVGVPWHCGQQKLLTLTRVLTQAQSYVSIIKVLLPAHLPTCSCSRWADPGLTPTSFVSPDFEVVVCVLLTSQCFQAKLILGCSVFPGFMDESELSKVLYIRAETRSFVI